MGLCGIKPPAGMQGANLAGLVRGEKIAAPDSAFFQIFGPYEGDGTEDGWRGVRTDRYMYARFRTKPWVLYDLQKDPFELKNLVDDPAAAPVLKNMEARLSAWMQKTGDSWDFNWHELVEDKGRLYHHRTFYTVQEYLDWVKANPEQTR